MKKRIYILSVILLATLILQYPMINNPVTAETEEEFRAVWISTVLRLDYPKSYTTDDTALKSQAIEVLNYARAWGFNAVILQVRPASDALYPSQIFPWSQYLTGTQGVAPDNGFDPLAFYVSEAHKRGLQLHAWLNPYRITQSSNDNSKLSATNPAVLHPELTVSYNSKLYYNPGLPEARQLIVDGVREILQNYEVDGIHLDDYFYPGTDFPDSAAFSQYGNGLALADWRRVNNDLLIKALYDAVHELKPSAVFGISPAGIWANKSSNALGSNTSGGQTYYTAYADTRGWVKKGWLDYIAPQIYWKIGYSVADYDVLVKWWADVVSDTSVKLYIGQAIYRAIDSGWGAGEIKNQMLFNRRTAHVHGYIMFRYLYIKNYVELSALMTEMNPVSAPLLPFVENIEIAGQAVEGQTLSVNYLYSDPLSRPETGTIIQWLIDGVVNYTGSSLKVSETMAGKTVSVRVTPKCLDALGTAVQQTMTASVLKKMDIDGDGTITQQDAFMVLQAITGNFVLSIQQLTAVNAANGALTLAHVRAVLAEEEEAL